mgnify:CR=1 FL=1
MNLVTLKDLNFYSTFLKDSVKKKLESIDKNVSDEIIDSAIKEELSNKMKDERRFKKELESLYANIN